MEKDFKKEKKALKKTIEKWNLNLSNLTVLTEAALGNYIYTPIIAAMAGGKVYALTKDSIYGTAKKVKKETLLLAKKYYHQPEKLLKFRRSQKRPGIRDFFKEFLSYIKENKISCKTLYEINHDWRKEN